MKNLLFLPNYRRSILSLSNTILDYYGVSTPFQTLPALRARLKQHPKNVVLWILDGMGIDLMQKNLGPRAFLRQHVVQEISSTFPPTTATATTTYYSGLPPIMHGWAGWAPYFADQGKYIALFSGRDDYTQEPSGINPAERLAYRHIFDRIREVASAVTCTEIFPKKIRPDGAETFREQGDRILEQAQKSGEQFILAYWPDPDSTCHHQGTYGKEAQQVLRHMNMEVRRVCQRLKNTLVIISADHGHVPIERIVYLNDYPDLMACLNKPIGLDDRVSSIFLKPGTDRTFQCLVKKYLGHDFILIPSDRAIQKGLFGKGPAHPEFRGFLGDYLLVAVGSTVLRQKVNGYLSGPIFYSSHAGLTRREMVVPLIIVDQSKK